jgi:hypothetical protein
LSARTQARLAWLLCGLTLALFDAAKTLEDFTAKLCRETALENLRSEMLEVVRDTVQPEKASLWLKGPSGNASRNVSEMGKR